MSPDGSVDWQSPTGPTAPLPPRKLRRWPRPIGFLFWCWCVVSIFTACVVIITLCFPFVILRVQRVVWWIERVWARTLLTLAGVRVETVFETPLGDEPVIFACNHQSNFDIMALFVGLGRPFRFIAKASVFRYPFLGWHISAAGYIKVDRGDRAQAIESLRRAGERIRSGTNVCVFPEGTRTKDGTVLPFKKGPFVMALEAGVPIVPVSIEGALDVNPKRTWYVCPNTIRIAVGAPIPTASLSDKHRDLLIRRVRESVIRLNKRLGGQGGDIDNAIAASGLDGIGHAVESEGTALAGN